MFKHSKFALITGASSSLGKVIASIMAENGIVVFALGSNKAALMSLKNTYPDTIKILNYDLSDSKSWKKISYELNGFQLNYVIHAATSTDPIRSLEQTDYDSWMKIMAINLHAPIFLTRALLANSLSLKSRILFISSAGAQVPIAGFGAHCISQAGLEMARKIMSVENKPYLLASFVPNLMDIKMHNHIKASTKYFGQGIDYFFNTEERESLDKLTLYAECIYSLLTKTSDEDFTDDVWDLDDFE